VLRVLDLVWQDERKMARFAQYAMAASEEALEDAGWKPTSFEEREATVRNAGCGTYSSAAADDASRVFAWVPGLGTLMRSMTRS
jgi:3-oxoacyl-(acyl-carrier-protein) synthase